jgi:hypothetical protein
MENLLLLLIWWLIPVVTVGPTFLVSGWIFHKLVPQRKQRLFAILASPIIMFAWIIFWCGIPSHSWSTILLKGATMGIGVGPILALEFSKRWPQCDRTTAADPIGSETC